MIKDLVKGAVKGAAVWVGNTIGGPTGAAIGGKLADSLLTKKAGGGEVNLTIVRMPDINESGVESLFKTR